MTKNWFRGRRSLEFMLHTKSVQNAMKKYTQYTRAVPCDFAWKGTHGARLIAAGRTSRLGCYATDVDESLNA